MAPQSAPLPGDDSADTTSANQGDARLAVMPAHGQQQTVFLSGDVTSIGRSPDNHVVLSGDKRASRRHAEIRWDNGAFVLHDLDSSNGTFVDGRRVSRHTLRDGDRLGIGDAQLVFSWSPRRGADVPEAPGALGRSPANDDGLAGQSVAGTGSEASVVGRPQAIEPGEISLVESPMADGAVEDAEVDRLLLLAERAERDGQWVQALALYRQSLDYLASGGPLFREVESICGELQARVGKVPLADSGRGGSRPAPLDVSQGEDSPDELRFMLERAEKLERAGDIGGAVALYQDLMVRLPSTSPLRDEVSMIHAAAEVRQAGRHEAGRLVDQAERLEEQGDSDGALALYRQALTEAPSNSALRRELELVIADLEATSRDRIKVDLAAGHRAEGLEQAGRWAEADAAYQELLAETQDPKIRARFQSRLARCQEEIVLADLFQRGVKASQASDWVQAQQLFSQVVRRRPGYQFAGQMAALWLKAVSRHVGTGRKPRLGLWSAAGGVLVLLLLVIVIAAAFAYNKYRQSAAATAVAGRVATLQAAQTATVEAIPPTPTPLPTLTPEPSPTEEAAIPAAISRNGTIAFASDSDGNWNIFTIRPDGTRLTRLTDNPADDTDPVWAPDGRQLAFVSDREGNEDVFLMAADGSAVRQLTRDKASDISPTWSPDGKQLVFATNLLSGGDGYDLWVMDVDGGDVTLLTTSASEPDWSPDGRRVAAVFHFPGVTTIGLVPVDGNAGPQPLLEMQGSQSPAWSPEGVRIIFSAPAEGGDHLHTINPDGSDVVDLSAAIKLAGRQPTWSRDARDVAFVATVDGNQDIWIAAIDGGRPIRLTDDPGRDASPSWSP